jgi:hypothetical protein
MGNKQQQQAGNFSERVLPSLSRDLTLPVLQSAAIHRVLKSGKRRTMKKRKLFKGFA